MRVAVNMALGCLLLASAPVASADPAEPPEVAWDPARTVFVDNPAIVDPHSTRIESIVRGPGTLWVNFTAGTPDCFGVHVTATETPQSVTVELHGGTPPEAVGRMCIALAVAATVDVPLRSPLADRQVLVPV